MNGIKSALLVMVLTLWTTHALAQSTGGRSSSGVIHFQGAIVEPGCDMAFQQRKVITTCFREGKNSVMTSSPEAGQVLPADLATSEVNWLNSQHTLGVMTVSYK